MATDTYDSPGSHDWDWPEESTHALVQVWGGGGGGGDSTSEFGAAGGGGGGYSRVIVGRGEGIDTLEITVGSGGAAGNDGENSFVEQDGEVIATADGGSAPGAPPFEMDGGGGGAGAQFNGGGGGSNDPQVTMFFTIPSQPAGAGGGAAGGQNIHGNIGSRPNETTPGPGGAGRMKGGSGGRGGKGIDDTAAEVGEAGEPPGGGGGGGGQGKSSGGGAPGMVKITCPPPLDSGSDCCCGCPPWITKDALDLPDTITAAFSVLSSSDDGIPSPTVIDSCGDNDVRMTFEHSTAIASLLSSIPFTFDEFQTVESGCATCCFRYLHEGELTLGASPFPVVTIGEATENEYFIGIDSGCSDDPITDPTICPTSAHDVRACRGFFTVSNGALYEPGAAVLMDGAALHVCLQGNTATVCVNAQIKLLCTVFTGTFRYREAGLYPALIFGIEECEAPSTIVSGSASTGETYTTASINLIATADLTEVSGSTIWEKIQNAEWESIYEIIACHCSGGGCTGTEVNVYYLYCINTNGGTCLASGDSSEELDSEAIDHQCYYAVGDMSLALS